MVVGVDMLLGYFHEMLQERSEFLREVPGPLVRHEGMQVIWELGLDFHDWKRDTALDEAQHFKWPQSSRH